LCERLPRYAAPRLTIVAANAVLTTVAPIVSLLDPCEQGDDRCGEADDAHRDHDWKGTAAPTPGPTDQVRQHQQHDGTGAIDLRDLIVAEAFEARCRPCRDQKADRHHREQRARGSSVRKQCPRAPLPRR